MSLAAQIRARRSRQADYIEVDDSPQREHWDNLNNFTYDNNVQIFGVDSEEADAEDLDWKPAQDALLLSLTEEGLNPTEVAEVCDRTEQEVIQRYLEITCPVHGNSVQPNNNTRHNNVRHSNVRHNNVQPNNVQPNNVQHSNFQHNNVPTMATAVNMPLTRNPVVRSGAHNIPTRVNDDNRYHTRSDFSNLRGGMAPSEFDYIEQRRHQERIVTKLSQQYVLDHDTLDKIRPDRHFSLLDCKLLTLLEAKQNQDDKWLDLQREFLDDTERFVDIRYLKKMSEDADNPTGYDTGYDTLTDPDQKMLEFLKRKQEQDSWVTIMAEFARATGRIVDVNTLKQKLGGSGD